MPYRSEKFEQLLGLIDRSYHNVVECRHESWWSKEVIDNFRQHKLSFCGVSYPNLPWKVVATTNTLYYRFHGVPKLYISSYEDSFLEKIATGIKKSGVKSAFVYFNNTAGPAAVENAGFIRDFLKTRGY
jgi:uncharacterized protein YecE (DUF72 family)